MRFTAAALPGLIIVDIAVMSDDRGYFARTFCAEEFAAAGLPTVFPQCNTSFNLATRHTAWPALAGGSIS